MSEKFLSGALVHIGEHAKRLERLAEAMQMHHAAKRVATFNSGLFEHAQKYAHTRELAFVEKRFIWRGEIKRHFRFHRQKQTRMQRDCALLFVFRCCLTDENKRLFTKREVAPRQRGDFLRALPGVREKHKGEQLQRCFRSGENAAKLFKRERTRGAHGLAACLGQLDFGERVALKAFAGHEPVQKRAQHRLILAQSFRRAGVFRAPCGEALRRHIGEARPFCCPENFADAKIHHVGILRRFAACADVGGVFFQQIGEARLRGLAVRAGGQDANGGALLLDHKSIEEGEGGGLVSQPRGDFARLVAALDGIAARPVRRPLAILHAAENVLDHWFGL